MALEDRTKKELAQIIRELQDKLKELKPVESALTSQLEELHHDAIGLRKDEAGQYALVYIKYDAEKNAAAISEVKELETKDPAIAIYKLNQFTHETIMRKARGSKYDIK